MKKQQFHKLIATILLVCMVIMNMPIHNFMHNHNCNSNNKQQTETVDKYVETIDCWVCAINQITHNYFNKPEQQPQILKTRNIVFAEIIYLATNNISTQTNNKAPPIC